MAMKLPALEELKVRFDDEPEDLDTDEIARQRLREQAAAREQARQSASPKIDGISLDDLATEIELTDEQLANRGQPIQLDPGDPENPSTFSDRFVKDTGRGVAASLADTARHTLDAAGNLTNNALGFIRDSPEMLASLGQGDDDNAAQGVHGQQNAADRFRAPQDKRIASRREVDVNFYGNTAERHAFNKYVNKNAENGGDVLFTSWASEQMKRIADEQRAARTPEFQALNSELSAKIEAADTGVDKFAAGFMGIATEPALYVPYMGEVVGSLASQLIGGAITKGMRLGATVGSIGTGMITSGGASADASFQELMQMDPAFFRASERFVELGELGFSDEEARERLAYELSEKVGLSTALVTGLTSILPGFGRVDRLLGGGLRQAERKSGAVVGAIKSGVGEGGQEVVENEAANFGGNVAQRSLDSSHSLTEDFGNSGMDAVLGVGAGVGTHAGMSALDTVMGRTGEESTVRQLNDPPADGDTQGDTDGGDPSNGGDGGNSVPGTDGLERTAGNRSADRDTDEQLDTESDVSLDETDDQLSELGGTRANVEDTLDNRYDWQVDDDGFWYRDGPNGEPIYWSEADQQAQDAREGRSTPSSDTTSDTQSTPDTAPDAAPDGDSTTDSSGQLDLDLEGNPQQLDLDLDSASEPAPQSNVQGELDLGDTTPSPEQDSVGPAEQANRERAEQLRSDPRYGLDDSAEIDDFVRQLDESINDQRRPTSTPNSADAGSQARSSESTQRGVNTNERSRTSRDSTQGDSRDDQIFRQQENNADGRGQDAQPTQRNQGRNVAENRSEAQSGQVESQADGRSIGPSTQAQRAQRARADRRSGSYPPSTTPAQRSRQSARQTRDAQRTRATLDNAAARTNGRVEIHDSADTVTMGRDARPLSDVEGKGFRPAAFFDPDTGKVVIIADRVADNRTAKALLAHEAVHAGLRDALGSESAVRKHLEALFDSDPEMKYALDKMMGSTRMDLNAYRSLYGDDGMPLSVFIEEVIAHAAENESARSAVQKMIKKIIDALEAIGVKLKLRNPRQGYTAERALIDLMRTAEKAFYGNRPDPRRMHFRDVGMPDADYLRRRYSLIPEGDQIPMYSALHKAALEMKQKKGKPKHMLETLRKQPGVKEEEIQWSGLDLYLDGMTRSVTSEEIANYAFEHGPSIQDVYATDTNEDLGVNDGTMETFATQLEWGESRVDTSRENWDYRIEDYMHEFDNGNYEDHIMDMDAAIEEVIASDPDSLIAKVLESLEMTDDARQRMLFNHVMTETERAHNGNTDGQVTVSEQDIEKMVADVGMELTTYDDISEFAEQFYSKDYLEASESISSDIKDSYAQDLRDDYEQKAEEAAEQEYMDGDPRIDMSDSEHGYEISGSPDYGFTLFRDGDVIESDFFEISDAQQAAHIDAVEMGLLGFESDNEVNEGENTQTRQYTDEGDWDIYNEHLVTLPDLEADFHVDSHFKERNIVAFVRSTNRTVTVKWDGGQTSVKPYFIEELQSDWHNKGSSKGYDSKDSQERLNRMAERGLARMKTVGTHYTNILNDDNGPFKSISDADKTDALHFADKLSKAPSVRDAASIASAMRTSLRDSFRLAEGDGVVAGQSRESFAKGNHLLNRLSRTVDTTFDSLKKVKEQKAKVPDAPFKGDRWIGLAMRKSILKAIEQGYGHIGWSSADTTVARWSEKYRKLYTVIYDVQMPSIAKDLLKSKPVKTERGDWVVEIKPKESERIKRNSLPLFATQPTPATITNRTNTNRHNFERSSAWWHSQNLKRRFVEQYETILEAEDWVRRKPNGVVDENNSLYQALKSMRGRLGGAMMDINHKYVQGLTNELRARGLSREELGAYVYAMHADERNVFLRDKFGMPGTKNPSGMSKDEADAILDYFQSEGKLTDLQEAAKIVEAMRVELLEKANSAGLITKGMMDEYNARFQHYVPLKGFAVTIGPNGEIVEPAIGRQPLASRGANVSGKEFREMLGRQSKAFDPVSTMLADLVEKTTRAEKNHAMGHFLRFIIQNPDSTQWGLYSDSNPKKVQGKVRRKDPVTGQMVTKHMMASVSPATMAKNMASVKYKGKQFYVEIHNGRLREQVLNGNAEQVSGIFSALRGFNRFRAYVLTSLSPIFAAKNFVRDYQTAVLKIKGEQTRSDGQLLGMDIAGEIKSTVFPSMRSMHRALNGKAPRSGNELDQAAYDYIRSGGKVGYYTTRSPEEEAAHLDKMVNLYTSGKITGGARKALDTSVELSSH